MPHYDYKCKSCDHCFEIFQRISDDLLKECPSCSKDGLIRLIGKGSGIIFKGSGFYATDYKNKDKPKVES